MAVNIPMYVQGILGEWLHGAQVNSLSAAVEGLIAGKEAGIAAIGNALPGESLGKSKIKRVDRLVGNKRLSLNAASEALIHRLCGLTWKRVLVASDWTFFRRWVILFSSIVTRSRAIPVYWTVIDINETRMPEAEFDHFRALQVLFPSRLHPILLLDRGFDSVALQRHLQSLDFSYIVRLTGSVNVRIDQQPFVAMNELLLRRGCVRDHARVDFSKSDPIRIRLTMLHDYNHKEPWLLGSFGLESAPAKDIVWAYGRRFEIEESFRDLKDLRAGFKLRRYRPEQADRFARLLLIAVLAYLLLFLAGTHGEKLSLQRRYQSNTVRNKRVIAIWRLGSFILRDYSLRLETLWRYLPTIIYSEAWEWTA